MYDGICHVVSTDSFFIKTTILPTNEIYGNIFEYACMCLLEMNEFRLTCGHILICIYKKQIILHSFFLSKYIIFDTAT